MNPKQTELKTYLVQFERTVTERVEVEIELDPEDYTINTELDLEYAINLEVDMLDVDDGEVLERSLGDLFVIDDYKELTDD